MYSILLRFTCYISSELLYLILKALALKVVVFTPDLVNLESYIIRKIIFKIFI